MHKSTHDLATSITEEIFDVVNEHDQVIGQHPRSYVHSQNLLHRAVHVLVYNAKQQLFVQKRSMLKDSSAGLWDTSAAGHLDSGENYDSAASRELEEELGCRPKKAPKRLFKFSASEITGHEFCWIYSCEMEGPFVLNPEEIETGRWVSLSELETWLQRAPADFGSTFKKICAQLGYWQSNH